MGKNKVVRSTRIFNIIAIVIFFILLSAKAVSAYETKTIKVGYIDYSGFIDAKSDGTMSGYGVSYLNEIAKYTNWNYTYEYDEWDDCMEKLASGEIDLICSAQYTPERSELYDYSNYSIGIESNIVYTRINNKNIYYEDYEAMDGLTVGLLSGSYQNETFKTYAKDNQFSYKTKLYQTESEMLDALENGHVDMIATGSLALHKDLKTVGKFGLDPFYFITTKGKENIIKELDKALCEIKSRDPYFECQLYQQFYSTSASTVYPLFTRAEAEYIQESQVLNVGCLPNYFPLSSYDKEDGMTGIYQEILEEISNKSGLKFALSPTSYGKSLMEEVISKKEDVVIGVIRCEQQLENKEIALSSEFMDGQAITVGKSGTTIDLGENLTVALTADDQYLNSYLKTNRPGYKIIKEKDIMACMTAVAEGKADILIHNSYVVSYFLQNPHYESLVILQAFAIEEPSCIAIRSDQNPLLLSILNKTIESLEEDKINEIISNHTLEMPYQMSFEELVYKYRVTIVILVILLMVCTTLVVIILRKKIQTLLTRKENEVLREKTQRDSLTNLYNRETFYEKAHEILIQHYDMPYQILTINIERFKVINDLFGMEEGDRLLQYMGECFAHCVDSKECVVGRLDADNFAVCIANVSEDKEALFKPLFDKLEAYPLEIKIVVRCGVYKVDDHNIPVNIMCDRANLASESVKGSYLNHVGIYDEKHRRKLIAEQEILNKMHDALEHEEFVVYIQPKVRLSDETLIGGEALIRWMQPIKGMIPPNDFIPVFERNGFIVQVDYYIWEATCKILHKWKKEGKKIVPISVNVSRMDFYTPNLCEKLVALVKKYDLEPSLLELEITESAYTDNANQLSEVLKKLQKKGFKILMDDFGSGYSSLNMLKEVPVDVLKLDLKFLQGKDFARRGEDILSAVVSMSKKLELPVIAEGVETEAQVQFLREIQCEYAQGYYYSKPLPVELFEKYMQ